MTAASTAYGMYQSGQQGKREESMANYQAAVANNNKILADRQAADAIARGATEAQRKAEEGRQLAGRQRAMLAANGVLVDSGSASDIVSDTYGTSKLNQLIIRGNAEREAGGWNARGMGYESEAGLAGMKASNARAGATEDMFGTLLKGGSAVAGKWDAANRAGIDIWPKASFSDSNYMYDPKMKPGLYM